MKGQVTFRILSSNTAKSGAQSLMVLRNIEESSPISYKPKYFCLFEIIHSGAIHKIRSTNRLAVIRTATVITPVARR